LCVLEPSLAAGVRRPPVPACLSGGGPPGTTRSSYRRRMPIWSEGPNTMLLNKAILAVSVLILVAAAMMLISRAAPYIDQFIN
jgi:hypothetical protein